MERTIIVVDCTARGRGRRYSTLDVIGVGPRKVASFLRSLGYEVELYPIEAVFRNPSILKKFRAAAVSFMVSDLGCVERFVRLWERYSGGPLLLGGPGALKLDFLDRIRFSAAILGEAEIPLLALHRLDLLNELLDRPNAIDKTVLRTVPGLAFREGHRVYMTGIAPWAPRELIDEPLPDIEGLKRYDFYWACRVYVEVVRGCSNFRRPRFDSRGIECIDCGKCMSAVYRERVACPLSIPPGCGYCSVPAIHGPPRSRSVESVAKEIRFLCELGCTRIVLSAPDFLDYGRDALVYPEPLTDPRDPPPNIDAIERLLSEIVKIPQVSEGRATIMVENLKPCLVNEYVAEVLARYLRGSPVYVGLESASDSLLERVGRPCGWNDVVQAIKILRRYGFRVYVYLMHGIPSETPEDVEKTVKAIDILEDLGVERIVLYRFTPLPFTAFERFPRPPPAVEQKHTRKLYDRVKIFNERAKERLVGSILKVVIASRYPKKRGYLVAYPVPHGPTVIVRTSSSNVGRIAYVKVTRVVSDRLVEGEVLRFGPRIVRIREHAY